MPSVRAREVFAYIAANIRRARARTGLTQEQLAEAAELDLRFVQRVEGARTNLSVAVVVALADALGVSPGSLFKKAQLPAAQRGRPPKRSRPAKKTRPALPGRGGSSSS